MFGFTTKVIGAALLIAGCISTAASAQNLASLPRAGVAVQASGEAKPLAAWTEFCRRAPGECAVDPSEAAAIQLTPRIWSAIQSINTRVNGTLKAVTDDDHWGVADSWDLPTDGAGDCEDFQILKRHLLVREGLPRRAMRMTVVIDGRGDGHAVLMIRTDRGDFVLDNKTNAIKPWFETGYVYVKRESQDRIGWVSLGRATSPTQTANW